MVEVYKNIFVGKVSDCNEVKDEEFAFVHATKTVFKEDKDKVLNEEENHLYVNWVDSWEEKYFNYLGNGANVVIKVLDFIDKWIKDRKILIHCDEGKSRSPSIAMVYMSKRLKVISDLHIYAKDDFSKIYFDYLPNKGINDFLFLNWNKIK